MKIADEVKGLKNLKDNIYGQESLRFYLKVIGLVKKKTHYTYKVKSEKVEDEETGETKTVRYPVPDKVVHDKSYGFDENFKEEYDALVNEFLSRLKDKGETYDYALERFLKLLSFDTKHTKESFTKLMNDLDKILTDGEHYK